MFRCRTDVPPVQQIILERGPPAHTHYDVPNFNLPPPPKELDTRCYSSEPSTEEIVEIENVTVKFRISETQVVAQVYPNRMCIGDVKQDIARKFELDPKLLCLAQDEFEFSDDCLILDTIPDEFGIYEYSLTLVEPKKGKLGCASHDDKPAPKFDLNVYYDKFRLADFITVHIPAEDTEDGNPKNVVVEIQNKAIVKPFICGYRNKATGVEYHDAFTQTGPYFDKIRFKHIYSRDTQTYEYREKHIDTMHEQSSQCFLDGNNVLFVSAATDFTIIPRKYQSYAQKMRLENKLNKIILIQRNWRRFLAVRFMRNAARKYRELIANRIANEESYKREGEIRLKKEQRAKQFPRTKDDFELLYEEVQKWKIAELKRIASMYDGAARKAEICLLLDKEIQLLNGINRQRKLVIESMEDFRLDQLLTKMGDPIKWIGYKSCTVHMDLLRNQRVRFLTEIYRDLQKPLPKEERLELLKKVKEVIVKEENFPAFPELFDLIEREKNLLLYTHYCDVEVLRKRQNLIFIDLIKFAEVRPKFWSKQMCTVCQFVKPTSEFALRTRNMSLEICQKCFDLQVMETNTHTFKALLRTIQREERRKHCTQSYAFVLQVDDIRYIVERIWHGHSILSMNTDLAALRLPRWIRSDDWSPWNCICLTESEARDHINIDDVEKVYSKKFILKVQNCQMLARRCFETTTAASVRFLESGEWFNVGMNQQRIIEKIPILNHTTLNELEELKKKLHVKTRTRTKIKDQCNEGKRLRH